MGRVQPAPADGKSLPADAKEDGLPDACGRRAGGGQWNFDVQNRRTFRDWKSEQVPVPALPVVQHDAITSEVIALIAREFPENPGRADGFWLPVTRASARKWLASFIRERLPGFGDFEDIMASEHLSLFHSVLSPLLNIGLLTPAECAEGSHRGV